MENYSFVIEVFNDGHNKIFIVRQIMQPNLPAKVCAVCTSPDELADYFGHVVDNSVRNDAA